jgi:glycerophosphoryl diester phosphodiesterase
MKWQEFREVFAPDRPLVVAHRGVPVRRPENTLASFRLALDEGADALETDLRFTRDDVIVLHHDATLERTTTGEGPLRTRTLQEIRTLRTRYRDGSVSDETVPTLHDLVALTGGAVPLLLELKDPLFLEADHARILADTLASLGMSDKVALVSFHQDHVRNVKSVAPELAAGYITIRNPYPVRGAQVLGPLWPLLYLNPYYVRMAHKQGSIVCPLDPTPEKRVPYYLKHDVDALLADDPASVLAAVHAAMGGA